MAAGPGARTPDRVADGDARAAGAAREAAGPVEHRVMDVAGHVALRFVGGPHTGAHTDLTAVHAAGEHLWVAGDETPAVERLVLDAAVAPGRAGRQRTFRLAHFVQLPGAATGESDVQGMAVQDGAAQGGDGDGGWLWVIGSHALVRRRPKPEHDDAKVVRRLGKLRRDPNRFVIVRLALQLGVDRRPEPVRVARDGRRSALVGAPGAETLVDLLRADAHLAPFLAIPGQDNGFHVGGLAVVGERLYVGLRGPVLRGWAVVLELLPVQDPTDPGRLALGIFPEGARYRKHFLDLAGLGVADLCVDGGGDGDPADLLVLAAPTMVLSGPVRVHRWSGAAAAGPVVPAGAVPVEADLGHGGAGEGGDAASGITLLPPDPLDPRARLLVVHDSPAPDRRPWPDTVLADRVRLGREPDVPGAPVTPDVPGVPVGVDVTTDGATDREVALADEAAGAEADVTGATDDLVALDVRERADEHPAAGLPDGDAGGGDPADDPAAPPLDELAGPAVDGAAGDPAVLRHGRAAFRADDLPR